jgi:nucleotide-binding universal stress UspA family protein
MKSILCPVDFSKNSEAAVFYSSALADAADAHLLLLHCYELPPLFEETPVQAIRETEKQLMQMSGEKLARLQKRLMKRYPRLRMETDIRQAVAATTIPAVAAERGVDLIVIGATGDSKWKRIMMGSTAAKVVRDAPCAVLTIPADAKYSGIHRIAYATDLHEDNLRAASAILPFARANEAELSMVFVDDRHLLHDDERVEAMTRKIKTRLKYPGLSGYIAKDTDIGKGLERFVKKFPTDLLVLFTHDRHFPETLFSHSVTRLVSHRVRVPLLSFKQDDRPAL